MNRSLPSSKKISHSTVFLIILILSAILYFVFYFGGLVAVPFHPDEATQIFMSSDVDMMLKDFKQVFWQIEKSGDLHQRYRELDAPLTRYLIGVGRFITRAPALASDWDWAKSWAYNQASGALPSASLLLISRFSVSFLSLITLGLFYDLVRRMTNPLQALLAAILLAMNPLFLLHTRRAMAESALLMTIVLSIWVINRYREINWKTGLCLGLAFCAKQTGVILLLIPLLGTLLNFLKKGTLKTTLEKSFYTFGAFLGILILLNPFIWKDPVHSIPDAIRLRQQLLQQQQSFILEVSPEKSLSTLPNKIAGMIGSIYFQSPAVADVANYVEDNRSSEIAYFSNPLNNLGRDLLGPLLSLVLTLIGFILNILHARKNRSLRLFIFAAISFVISIPLLVQLPFQRYYLPVIIFNAFWISSALYFPIFQISKKFFPILNPSSN